MKLIFPNHEHADVVLADQVTRIGSAADCDVQLQYPGVAPAHAEIGSRDGHHVVRVLADSEPTVLNGKQLAGETVLRPGDLLLFGRIGCRVGTVRQVPSAPVGPPQKDSAQVAQTLLRAQLPLYVLRGQSGPVAGKSLRVIGSMAIGRDPECDLVVDDDGVSRKHARLRVTAEGLAVEDLGSANGTFIDDARISNGVLLPGSELRLDTVRFLLSAPAQPAGTRESEVLPGRRTPWLGIAIAALVVIAGWFLLVAS